MPEYNFLSNPTLYLKLHSLTIGLSYVIFFVATVSAALYLLQNSAIKHKQTGIIFNRLPDLAFLDKLNYQSICLGFPLLTIAILSGFVWADHVHGAYWTGANSRHMFTLVLWLIYALTLHVRLSAKLRGRKVALLTLLASFVIILSLFGACQ